MRGIDRVDARVDLQVEQCKRGGNFDGKTNMPGYVEVKARWACFWLKTLSHAVMWRCLAFWHMEAAVGGAEKAILIGVLFKKCLILPFNYFLTACLLAYYLPTHSIY